MDIAADFIASDAYTRSLSMIARKLGHDWLLLMSDSFRGEKKWFRAILGHYDNDGIELLETNGSQVWLKNVDAEGGIKSVEDMYAELARLLYKTLKSGGKLSDGRFKLSADEVPEFMIECVLNGF